MYSVIIFVCFCFHFSPAFWWGFFIRIIFTTLAETKHMTPKEKAVEIVEKYKYYVHGYIGSSMLTNTEYPEQILSRAKQCALIAVDEIVANQKRIAEDLGEDVNTTGNYKYWQQVKTEIEAL